MSITVRPAKKEELERLEQMEETSFHVNSKYFENGILPPLPEEDKEEYSFKAMCEAQDTDIWTILIEDELAEVRS